jgi:hypothetical protein
MQLMDWNYLIFSCGCTLILKVFRKQTISKYNIRRFVEDYKLKGRKEVVLPIVSFLLR